MKERESNEKRGREERRATHTCTLYLLGFKCVCVGTLSSHFKALLVIELESVTRSLCVVIDFIEATKMSLHTILHTYYPMHTHM